MATKYTLRPYQREASATAVEFLKSKETGGRVIVAPTGSGKSLFIADIASKLDGNVLVLQPSKEILEQNLAKLQAYGIEDIGVYSAAAGRKEVGRITLATIGSIIKRKELFDGFKALLVDEAHNINAREGQYKDFIKAVAGRKIVGLTATPYRLSSQRCAIVDGQPIPITPTNKAKYLIDNFRPRRGVVVRNMCMEKLLTRTRPALFKGIAYEIGIKGLVEQGYLSRLEYYPLSVLDTSRIQRNSTGMGFDELSLREEIRRVDLSAVLQDIGDRLSRAGRKHILFFTRFVDEARVLAERLGGDRCKVVSGDTPKAVREEALRAFTAGEFPMLANAQALTTGFDFPDLDAVVMAHPTMSLSLWQQIVGRAIRASPNKAAGWVIDLGGNYARFGRMEDVHLVTDENGISNFFGIVDGQERQLTHTLY